MPKGKAARDLLHENGEGKLISTNFSKFTNGGSKRMVLMVRHVGPRIL